MRIIVLTNSKTDYARSVETFVTDFERRTGSPLEVMEAYSPEADSLAQTYDIMEYPTILALADDGQMQNMWRGASLPTISEVSYYVQ